MAKKKTDLDIGESLRYIRKQNNFTQKEVSEYLNIARQTYTNYENNERCPDLSIIYALACKYKILIDQLLNYGRLSLPYIIQEETTYGSDTRPVYETALLSGSEQVLVSLFRELHPDQQKELSEYIRFKLHENNTGKNKK